MAINKTLKNKILKMAKLDQKTRKKQWRELKILNQKFSDKNDSGYRQKINRFANQLKKIDVRNTEEMKKIIKKFGWPGKSLVGKQAAPMAWLLVQHADLDVSFQEQCLKLLKNAVARGEAEYRNVAYLTDRVLTHQRKKQLYGTQFHRNKKGEMGPMPIKDEANVDKRRKKMGLEPLSEYTKQMQKINKKNIDVPYRGCTSN